MQLRRKTTSIITRSIENQKYCERKVKENTKGFQFFRFYLVILWCMSQRQFVPTDSFTRIHFQIIFIGRGGEYWGLRIFASRISHKAYDVI